MKNDVFLDTNVLLYMISSEQQKAFAAAEIVQSGATVSVQVLNEFACVARRARMEHAALRASLLSIREQCFVRSLDANVHELGLDIHERYRYHIYDSMIIASALEAGCSTLYSEDFQHGQRIGGLTIRNPFQG